MTFDAITALVHSLRNHPEPASLPEGLDEASRVELAEGRSLFQIIAQRALEIRRIIDHDLAGQIAGGALRYGDQIIRTSYRGTPYVVNPQLWWQQVAEAIRRLDNIGAAELLNALYPVNSLRLTALPQLAAVLDTPVEQIRDNLIDYQEAPISLSVTPLHLAPKWTQRLQEGRWSGEKESDGA